MTNIVLIVFLCFRFARIAFCLILYNCLHIVLFYVAWSNTSETLYAYETRQYITLNAMNLKPKSDYTTASVLSTLHDLLLQTRILKIICECALIAPTNYMNLWYELAGRKLVRQFQICIATEAVIKTQFLYNPPVHSWFVLTMLFK